MTQERRSLKLGSQEWKHLEQLAKETVSIPVRVPVAFKGQSSWRNLIKRIAMGELLVSEKPDEE